MNFSGLDIGQLLIGAVVLGILVRWFIGLFQPSNKRYNPSHWRGGTPSEIRHRK